MSNEVKEILLVEDNPNDLKLAIRAFEENNINRNVVIAADGKEALDYLFARNKYIDRDNKQQPKLILLDLKLKKIDGLEVLYHLKNNPKTAMIPVVVMTSSKQESDLLRCYELGVNSYIVKPIDFDEFITTIADIGLYWLQLNKLPDSSMG